jgi:predicted AAA+ superfamily ATPase
MVSKLHPQMLEWALDPTLIQQRMSFIAGPRQIGKTTMLQNYLVSIKREPAYFNWDTPQVRRAYRANPDFFSDTIKPTDQFPAPVVFDEIHKYPKWKSVLKGLHDSWRGKVRFIVTGSARLDFFRKSGDSLVGRYYLFRKFPLHPRECMGFQQATPRWRGKTALVENLLEVDSAWSDATRQLCSLNGFPEPFLAGSHDTLTRWQTEHLNLLITEDLADLTKIEQVLRVEELADILRTKVGAPLSTNKVAGQIQAAFPTVKRWLDALELVYLTFRIPPFTHKIARAIQKEPKLYFWDWSLVRDEGARFENIVAVYLMRAVTTWNEMGLGNYGLHYVRSRDGIEADFLITNDHKPLALFEAKLSDTNISSSLLRIREWIKVPEAIQVVQTSNVQKMYREKGVWTIGLDRLLQALA